MAGAGVLGAGVTIDNGFGDALGAKAGDVVADLCWAVATLARDVDAGPSGEATAELAQLTIPAASTTAPNSFICRNTVLPDHQSLAIRALHHSSGMALVR